MKQTNHQENIRTEFVEISGETFLKMTNYDEMRSFFMSIVSPSDHWMFIASNGGLSAGRRNAEYSLFPYYTDDKITESADITGSKTIVWVEINGVNQRWEPFSDRDQGKYNISRNLYKNVFGNKLIFEEKNHSLNLTFRYQWNSSHHYGFIKKSSISNNNRLGTVGINILDGLQNILPYGVESAVQNSSSNLVDAYKRNELHKESGLGIFALSAIIVDKAEPSEALKANTVFSLGLDESKKLVSSLQLNQFRNSGMVKEEKDVKGEKGGYFVNSTFTLPADSDKNWMFVANVNQDHSSVVETLNRLEQPSHLKGEIEKDIQKGTSDLIALNASSDAIQYTADRFKDTRHFANTLFNIMRGGIFDNNYVIEKADLVKYLSKANIDSYKSCQNQFDKLKDTFLLQELDAFLIEVEDKNILRLCKEYLPLKFSRRHGDPSRPWNKFSINTQDEKDGSKILDYEGNWRDIFQNWEALALSFPYFIEGMIHKFLNASTFDGYNPYRVTKDGFDWEIIEPDDPWSYIGYWGDHQIIYLLKFLEYMKDLQPEVLQGLLDDEIFVYANVPYKIKEYHEILKDPKDTIIFDHEADQEIREKREASGADGALLYNQEDKLHRVNMMEKLLATMLAKISNFIPEGGIWMNTQRPEWNDANNALVGNGVSMVTLYYLRRFMVYFHGLINSQESAVFSISEELDEFFRRCLEVLDQHRDLVSGQCDDIQRKSVLDGLGEAGSEYRSKIYSSLFNGKKVEVSISQLREFASLCILYLDHSIRSNQRPDDLYHAYNLMTVESEESVSIARLSEMLEGQVAVLSSGLLSPEESLNVLDGLKASSLFRVDQYSYLLYPNKNLAGFLERNNVPKDLVKESSLLMKLINEGNQNILLKDANGDYHFNGNFKNGADLSAALDDISDGYLPHLEDEKSKVLALFEAVFNHKAFTGRSGTFYGYEGLGSIYWHMVSKLLLAVQETCLAAYAQGADEATYGRLLEHYYEIYEGIGVHKPPMIYGAFSTDPYSHTPAGKGAQQPGMTGQVKEDILCRFGELGVYVSAGQLHFNPVLLRREEFLNSPKSIVYIEKDGTITSMDIQKDELFFTFCQTPIIYKIGAQENIKVHYNDGRTNELTDVKLSASDSENLFNRNNVIKEIHVVIDGNKLR